MDLSIVVPVYNEGANLETVVPKMSAFAAEHNIELILVDDGSSDNSLGLLRELQSSHPFTLLRNKVNRGYGGAIKNGVHAATTEYVITIDADGQHDLQDVLALYKYLLETEADMVVGKRAEKASGWYRRLGKFLIRRIANSLMKIPVKDINSGMKIYNTEIAKPLLKFCPDTMAYSDIILLMFVWCKHKVVEKDITIHQRLGGTSTINYKTAIDTVFEIVNIVMLFNPLRIFMPVSLFFIASGVLWGMQFILGGTGLSVLALLLILIGILFAFLGLIAQAICKLRNIDG